MSGTEGGEPGRDLLDLPLRDDRGEAFSLPLPTEAAPMPPAVTRPAAFALRAAAAAADTALVALVVLLALIGAAAARDRWPALSGLPWAGAFALYVSFFATVVPLVLFGRTVGMALGDLVAAPRDGTRRLALREASLRWLGFLLTALTLGLALLFTRRDPASPTLADGLSGRPIFRLAPPPEDA